MKRRPDIFTYDRYDCIVVRIRTGEHGTWSDWRGSENYRTTNVFMLDGTGEITSMMTVGLKQAIREIACSQQSRKQQ